MIRVQRKDLVDILGILTEGDCIQDRETIQTLVDSARSKLRLVIANAEDGNDSIEKTESQV